MGPPKARAVRKDGAAPARRGPWESCATKGRKPHSSLARSISRLAFEKQSGAAEVDKSSSPDMHRLVHDSRALRARPRAP